MRERATACCCHHWRGIGGLPDRQRDQCRRQRAPRFRGRPLYFCLCGVLMCGVGTLHLHVAREHLADHGPLEHSRATAHARCLTTLHLTATTHIPSHQIPRTAGAL